MNVYLAGGMHSDWQNKVMNAYPRPVYFDPRSHGLKTPAEYTAWDLLHIKRADFVFAYFEKTNTSGFGLCLEIGYAKALGIPILLVDEVEHASWAIVRECAVFCTVDFEEGVQYFKDFMR